MTADERRTIRAAVDARRREVEAVPTETVPLTRAGRPAAWTHGTASGYRDGCRCDDCRAAATAARRLHRSRDARRRRLLAACAVGSPVEAVDQVRAVIRMLNQAARRNA